MQLASNCRSGCFIYGELFHLGLRKLSQYVRDMTSPCSVMSVMPGYRGPAVSSGVGRKCEGR